MDKVAEEERLEAEGSQKVKAKEKDEEDLVSNPVAGEKAKNMMIWTPHTYKPLPHDLSTDQFRRRTSALKLPEDIEKTA